MPDPKYKGKGASMLTDSETGTRNFNDGFWMGFHSNDLEATIDLGSVQPISEVSIGALHNAESWIFLPSKVTVAFSADGNNFGRAISAETGGDEETADKTISRFALQVEDVDVRFIKVEAENLGTCPLWHPAKSNPAYLFVGVVAVR